MRCAVLVFASVWILAAPQARAVELRGVQAFTTASGANCAVATPLQPNGKLLLIAHGFVPAARPLSVNLGLNDPVYDRLIDSGWTIAATSYRRNGLILADAAADVEGLRREVVARCGPMRCVVVGGTSMGGYIAALLAEAPPDPSYRGILALGAALEMKEPEAAAAPLSAQPRIPALFLSTQDEVAGPARYAGRAGDRAAVWKVARDGHVNLSRAEVGAAFEALERWIDGTPPERARDATLPPPPRPLTAAFSPDGRTLTAHVIDVDPVYGNLTIDLRPEDAEKLGWRKGEWASVRVGDGPEGAIPVLHGATFADVKEGAWVCFPTADGAMLLCRNFADAAASAKAVIGSPVAVVRPPTD